MGFVRNCSLNIYFFSYPCAGVGGLVPSFGSFNFLSYSLGHSTVVSLHFCFISVESVKDWLKRRNYRIFKVNSFLGCTEEPRLKVCTEECKNSSSELTFFYNKVCISKYHSYDCSSIDVWFLYFLFVWLVQIYSFVLRLLIFVVRFWCHNI